MRLLCSFCVLGIVFATYADAAQPYVPSNDSEVLVTLPRELLATRSELSRLRRALAENPTSPQLAAEIAGRYLQLGNQEGDPRFYGYAQAALQPWWEDNKASAEILKLRSKLKEKDHQYDAAIADLELLLKQTPDDPQAWLEVSNIRRVQGKYAEAEEASAELGKILSGVPHLLSQVPLMALTGQAEEAYAQLTKALPEAEKDWPSVVQWMIINQADIARALGRDELAEQHLKEGLSRQPGDTYLIRAYADFLLDRDRAAEALTLLEDHTSDNGSLLRAAIAAKQTGDKQQAAAWQTQMQNRFEEIRLRGSEPHGRFEARFTLELLGDPEKALELALTNWQKQKEYRDTRNVLEAALAANNPAAAAPVIAFLKEHNNNDVELQRLVQRLADKTTE